jgi:hypothetical protein
MLLHKMLRVQRALLAPTLLRRAQELLLDIASCCRVVAERFIDERTLCRIPWVYARFDEYNAALFRAFAAVAVSSISTRKMWSPQVWVLCNMHLP